MIYQPTAQSLNKWSDPCRERGRKRQKNLTAFTFLKYFRCFFFDFNVPSFFLKPSSSSVFLINKSSIYPTVNMYSAKIAAGNTLRSRLKTGTLVKPKPSLKIRTASAIFWNYLGIFRDYGLKNVFLVVTFFCFSR